MYMCGSRQQVFQHTSDLCTVQSTIVIVIVTTKSCTDHCGDGSAACSCACACGGGGCDHLLLLLAKCPTLCEGVR
jgi:hypothetical protein